MPTSGAAAGQTGPLARALTEPAQRHRRPAPARSVLDGASTVLCSIRRREAQGTKVDTSKNLPDGSSGASEFRGLSSGRGHAGGVFGGVQLTHIVFESCGALCEVSGCLFHFFQDKTAYDIAQLDSFELLFSNLVLEDLCPPALFVQAVRDGWRGANLAVEPSC